MPEATPPAASTADDQEIRRLFDQMCEAWTSGPHRSRHEHPERSLGSSSGSVPASGGARVDPARVTSRASVWRACFGR